jgi:hypothetical protein
LPYVSTAASSPLSLDAGDGDITCFLAYLIAA